MENHFKSTHDKSKFVKKFFCDCCGKVYPRKADLACHIMNKHKEKVMAYKCGSCDYATHSKKNLSRHLYIKHSTQNFQCGICDRGYPSEKIRDLHIKNVHEKIKKVLICWICSSECSSEAALERHLRKTHLDENRNFKCEHCEKTFFTKSVMKRHIENNHLNTVPCTFEGCDRKFFNERMMRRHYNGTHLEKYKVKEVGEHLCPICGKVFANKRYLKTHMKSHSTDRQKLTCKICGNHFLSMYSLSNHLKRHEILEPELECDECGKMFKLPSDLRVHKLQIHSDKPVCELCGRECKNQFALKLHLQGFHKQGYFPCDKCDHIAKTQNCLRKHIEYKHSERKTCDICDKTFSVKSTLARHYRSAHLNMKFTCVYPGCSKRYAFKGGVRKHLRTHSLHPSEMSKYNQLVTESKRSESLENEDSSSEYESD